MFRGVELTIRASRSLGTFPEMQLVSSCKQFVFFFFSPLFCRQYIEKKESKSCRENVPFLLSKQSYLRSALRHILSPFTRPEVPLAPPRECMRANCGTRRRTRDFVPPR